MKTQFFFQAVVAIFAVVDVIGGLPVFISLVEPYPVVDRRRILRLGGIVALIMICIMGLGGKYLLDLFKIRFESLMFGGGLLLMVIGIQNILGRSESVSRQNGASRQYGWIGVAVSPLACPLLAGPGALVTVMLLVESHGPLFAIAATLTAFAFVLLILNYAHLVSRVLGRIGTLAVQRVMQIFIVAIGVNFCFRALTEAFPGLLR